MPLHPLLDRLADAAIARRPIADTDALRILTDKNLPLEAILGSAFRVREHFFGKRVRIHILQNVQNGHCPEDCTYCAQSKRSRAAIEPYPMQTDEQILEGARRAAAAGAFRYCLVLSGRGPGPQRIAHFAELVRTIKARYPLEVCVSAGFIDAEAAQTLKAAGLDRYNHNLNTSARQYGEICTTHDYQDRLATLKAARSAGLDVCSGLIIGMGETPADLLDIARELRGVGAQSIPVNFYLPIPGSALGEVEPISSEYCLRALALFRFTNPDAEIRAAGGREHHLGANDSRCLLPANSVFAEGYLNAPGDAAAETVRMIREAGFEVESIEAK